MSKIRHMPNLSENNEIKDITEIEISGKFVKDKLQNFKKAIKNPYLFRVKNTRVKVVFSNAQNAPTVENILVNIAARSQE